jgi:pyruvate,water dikinase
MARSRRSSTRLVPLGEIAQGEAQLDLVGARAMALVDAAGLELPLLDCWVLPVDAFDEAVETLLPPAHDPASLLRVIHRPRGLERAARARDRLLSAPLPSLSDELFAFWDEVEPMAEWGLALRASPSLADDSVAATAGLSAIRVGVRGPEQLEHAVREIWASVVHEDGLRYLRAQRVRELKMAVLLQPLPRMRARGVMLTRDPLHGPRRVEQPGAGTEPRLVAVRVASAAFGLGSPVHDGVAAQDLVRFAADGRVLERRTVAKEHRLVAGERGPRAVPVAARKATRPALSQDSIEQLAGVAQQLDDAGRAQRDVEFVVAQGDGVRIADIRRSHGLGYPEGGSPTTVWSRAGLGESLSGVPSPLTWSLVDAFSRKGLEEAFGALGCKLPRNATLLTRVHGRFYLNLSALVPAVAHVPGIDPAALLDLVHDGSSGVLAGQFELKRRRAALARLPVTAARLFAQQSRLADDFSRFEREATQQQAWLAEMDLAILPDDSLITTLRETYQFFERTAELMLGCTLATLAAHIGLKTVLSRSTPVEAERLAQAITAGVGELDSAAPGVALAHVTAITRRDPDAARLLGERKVGSLAELPDGPARRALSQFIEAYGDRGLRESELMMPRWSQDPRPLFAMVAAGLRAAPCDPEERLSRARVRADREMAAVDARVPYVERALVRAFVSRWRVLARLRERMRVAMARTLNMLRIVALDVDRRMRRIDPALPEAAAFFCTFDELLSAVGRSRADLGPIIRMRRAAYQRDAAAGDPPETFVGAPPTVSLPPVGSSVLHGVGCGPGTVTGRARLVGTRGTGAADLEPGEILVLRSPDVGLSPLFMLSAGVLAELGGPLSHGGVVAREYGVPAVVGVRGLAATVRNGERLRVDGDRGVVERLDA